MDPPGISPRLPRRVRFLTKRTTTVGPPSPLVRQFCSLTGPIGPLRGGRMVKGERALDAPMHAWRRRRQEWPAPRRGGNDFHALSLKIIATSPGPGQQRAPRSRLENGENRELVLLVPILPAPAVDHQDSRRKPRLSTTFRISALFGAFETRPFRFSNEGGSRRRPWVRLARSKARECPRRYLRT